MSSPIHTPSPTPSTSPIQREGSNSNSNSTRKRINSLHFPNYEPDPKLRRKTPQETPELKYSPFYFYDTKTQSYQPRAKEHRRSESPDLTVPIPTIPVTPLPSVNARQTESSLPDAFDLILKGQRFTTTQPSLLNQSAASSPIESSPKNDPLPESFIPLQTPMLPSERVLNESTAPSPVETSPKKDPLPESFIPLQTPMLPSERVLNESTAPSPMETSPKKDPLPEPFIPLQTPSPRKYSFRQKRTLSYKGYPDEEPKKANEMIRLFQEKGIVYTSKVHIDPKYQAQIDKIWASISDGLLSDETDPEGKKCLRCIQKMKEDASDSYAQAVEVKDVVFTSKDGSTTVQKGLFAKRLIKEGTPIGVYAGNLMPLAEVKEENQDYVFNLSMRKFKDWGIDGTDTGNFTRYANHGNADKENLISVEFYDGKVPCIIFIASKNLPPGTQLLCNYGPGYWKRKGINPEDLT